MRETTDAVARARLALDTIYEVAANDYNVSGYVDARDALIAAVRAECADRVRGEAARVNAAGMPDEARGMFDAAKLLEAK